jgi:putative membrane protein
LARESLFLVFAARLSHVLGRQRRDDFDPLTMQPRLKKFIQSWLINTLAVLVAVSIVPGIRFPDKSLLTPFITSLVLGILNTFVRPVMLLLALPLLIFTLGLFTIVINALLLCLVGWLMRPAFEVDSFWWAMLGSLIISIVSLALNVLTGTGGARVTFHTHRRPPNSDDGGGPIIDV